MNFTETPIKDVWIIEEAPYKDVRGTFSRVFCEETFKAKGLEHHFPQINSSHSEKKYTFRGLHMQTGAASEVKVIRCLQGSIFDVVVDMRPQSATYGSYFSIELDESDAKQLYIPRGCAHGFLSLRDHTTVSYLVSHPYSPENETGIRWNDPSIHINWPHTPLIISEKDKSFQDITL